ncbi:MAG TPA: hypothetical protein VM536_00490 [Chloroflexia bacterium]|nr:hypothetical protein [Chloroflexia bacterium]
MKRIDPETYLQAPVVNWDADRVAFFEGMLADARSRGPGSVIAWQGAYPKHEFLTYLAECGGLLMHGSNRTAIRVLQPRSQVNYLGERVRAVFATPDGIWPMFFAVLDREVYEGSLRNGCFFVTDPAGETRKCYHFSINRELLPHQPWTEGMIYILDRAGFTRVHDLAGNPLEEWTSLAPVRPLARLPVAPEDFPFLAQVQGHDERELARLESAPGDLFKGFQHLTELEDGYALSYEGDEAWDAKLVEFIRLHRRTTPGLSYELVFAPDDGPIWLRLRGAAGKDAIKEKLHSFLDARNVPG